MWFIAGLVERNNRSRRHLERFYGSARCLATQAVNADAPYGYYVIRYDVVPR
jgi:hypothetical protein